MKSAVFKLLSPILASENFLACTASPVDGNGALPNDAIVQVPLPGNYYTSCLDSLSKTDGLKITGIQAEIDNGVVTWQLKFTAPEIDYPRGTIFSGPSSYDLENK